MFDSLRSRTAHRFIVAASLLAMGLAAVYWQQSKASKPPGLPPKISYYHWANSYTDDPASLKTYAPAQLYLKLLDIGYRDQQLSINPTTLRTPPSLPITPVVFLDNNALKADVLETVYAQILSHIRPQTYQRLQMDCDWTEQTRDRYFSFLTRLKAIYPQLSVTLRLHQVKYAARTGVPPAERAVLMYYNMSDIRDPETKNYILDPAVGQPYLQNFAEYPLPMDLALPLYQQTRVIRQGKLVHLANSAEPNTAKTERLEDHHYKVTHGHYWQEYYLYPEDELRVDTVDLKALQQASQQLKAIMQPNELIFYTLRDAARFPPDQLAAIAADFSSRSQPE